MHSGVIRRFLSARELESLPEERENFNTFVFALQYEEKREKIRKRERQLPGAEVELPASNRVLAPLRRVHLYATKELAATHL
jgi:hypothetical protein